MIKILLISFLFFVTNIHACPPCPAGSSNGGGGQVTSLAGCKCNNAGETWNGSACTGTGCSVAAQSWAGNCNGSTTAVGSGSTSTVTNAAAGYTGSATYLCTNGSWTLQSGSSCNSSAPCTGTWINFDNDPDDGCNWDKRIRVSKSDSSSAFIGSNYTNVSQARSFLAGSPCCPSTDMQADYCLDTGDFSPSRWGSTCQASGGSCSAPYTWNSTYSCCYRNTTVVACFAAGTKVRLPNGNEMRIEDLKDGDSVLSYNEETGLPESDTVKKTFYHEKKAEEIYVFELSTGRTVTTNAAHLFYLPDQKDYVAAEDVARDYLDGRRPQLLSPDGSLVDVLSVGMRSEETRLYNIHVKKNFNFFVEGFLVHNEKDLATVDEAAGCCDSVSSPGNCFADYGYPRTVKMSGCESNFAEFAACEPPPTPTMCTCSEYMTYQNSGCYGGLSMVTYGDYSYPYEPGCPNKCDGTTLWQNCQPN